MKKYLIPMFVAIVAMVAISACSKDDSEEQNPLVGTVWYSDNLGSYIYGEISGGKYYQIWQFTSENTYDEFYQNVATGEIGTSGHKTGLNYVYTDSCITVYNNENKPVKWYFVSSTKLSNHKDQSEPYTVVFNKQNK